MYVSKSGKLQNLVVPFIVRTPQKSIFSLKSLAARRHYSAQNLTASTVMFGKVALEIYVFLCNDKNVYDM